jgi:hypothetical protein
MRRLRIALPIALALIGAACSSSDDGGTGITGGEGTTSSSAGTTESTAAGEVPEGSTVGIGDDAITISIVAGDTEALAEAGVVPDVGDPVEDFETFAELANEAGGAGGRDIVVTAHLFPPGAPATDQQPACVQATEDDEAAIVIFIGGMAPELVLCATEEHERLAYAQSGILTQEVYDRSAGRLFNHAMSAERLMAGWAEALAAHGTLDGKTLGLVRADLSDHEAAAAALEVALEAQGFELAEQVALPCEANACAQSDLAIERLQAASVDTVFSLLGAIPYPTLVGAADAVGFEPQWLSSDFENQVFDVTGQFFEGVKENYEGAIGFTYGLEEPADDLYGEECNAQFTEVTGITYEPDTDAWRQVRSACAVIETIVGAANASQDKYGTLNQTTFIEGFETVGPTQQGDNVGTWSSTKHDAADAVVLKEFSADCLCWTEIEGTRGTSTG